MGRQERFRAEYRRLRAGWQDSLVVYRAAVGRNLSAGGRILDLGCGHADWLAPELAAAGFAVGIDPDMAALRRDGHLPNRVAAVAERLPFAAASFDTAVCAWVFEHLEEPRVVLSELRRVLRPGGRLVFLTPNTWNYNVWLIRLVPNRLHHYFTRRLYLRQVSDTYPVRYRLNSPRRIESTMRRAGFRRVELLLNGDPTYVGLNRPLFAAARALERLLDFGILRQARVHLIGVYELGSNQPQPAGLSGQRS